MSTSDCDTPIILIIENVANYYLSRNHSPQTNSKWNKKNTRDFEFLPTRVDGPVVALKNNVNCLS